MLANGKLDPGMLHWAEDVAQRELGRDWRLKKLDGHFAELIARDNEPAEAAAVAPSVDPRFDWWHVLLTAPNREAKAAKRLEDAKIPVYLPNFTRQISCGGRAHVARLCAVIPAMLFAPREIMAVKHRDALLDWAGIRDFMMGGNGLPALATRADIERVRIMEALLNLPPERKGVLFEVGQKVRFCKRLFAESWGAGTIFDIASDARIGLLVEKLFGRTAKIYVAASEIEAM